MEPRGSSGLTTFQPHFFTILCLLKSSVYFRITLSGHPPSLRQHFGTTRPDHLSEADYDHELLDTVKARKLA